MPQEEMPNRNLTFSCNKLLAQNANPISHETDLKGVPREEPKKSLITEVPNQQESRGMETGFKQSFVPFDPEERYAEFDSSIPAHYSWRGVPEAAFKEESDAHIHLEDSGCLLKSTNSKSHLAENQGTNSMEYKPLYADYRRNNIVQESPLKAQGNNVVVQDKNNVAYYHDFQPIHTCPPNIQGQGFDLSGPSASHDALKNLLSISGSPFGSSDEDLQVGWLQEDPFPTNLRPQNSEFIGYSDQCFVAEVPIHSYDTPRFDYEQFMDPNECFIAEHGLFIT